MLPGCGTWARGGGCLEGDVCTGGKAWEAFTSFLGELWDGAILVGEEEGGGGWR